MRCPGYRPGGPGLKFSSEPGLKFSSESGRIEGWEGSPGQVQEDWEVMFPHQVVEGEWCEQATSLHEAASYRCKIASQDVGSVSLDSEELPVALAELNVARLEREWWEAFLGFAQDHCEVPHLKALLTEVPLGEAEPVAAEQFLQTRTVGLEEARKELETWVEPGQDEIRALEVTLRG